MVVIIIPIVILKTKAMITWKNNSNGSNDNDNNEKITIAIILGYFWREWIEGLENIYKCLHLSSAG